METKPGGDSGQHPRAGNKPSRFGRHPKAGYHVQASVWIEKDGQSAAQAKAILEKYGFSMAK
jgi:hypothetical protein